MAAAPLTHPGQHRFRHRHRAEHVGGELALQIVHRGLLEHALVAVAGIVHQHVDRAGLPLGVGHGRGDRGVVGHVEHERMGTVARECREHLGVAVPPHGADHTMAGLQRAFSKCAPQA